MSGTLPGPENTAVNKTAAFGACPVSTAGRATVEVRDTGKSEGGPGRG